MAVRLPVALGLMVVVAAAALGVFYWKRWL